MFSIHNGNSFSSLPLIDTPLYCKLQGVFRSLSFIGFFPFQIFIKKSFNQTIVSCNLTGVSPLRGSRAALPIACDALNARTMAIREYHYVSCVSSPISCYTYFTARCWSLIPCEGSHGALAVWLGARGTYLICPMLRRRYLASLSLSRNKKAG